MDVAIDRRGAGYVKGRVLYLKFDAEFRYRSLALVPAFTPVNSQTPKFVKASVLVAKTARCQIGPVIPVAITAIYLSKTSVSDLGYT